MYIDQVTLALFFKGASLIILITLFIWLYIRRIKSSLTAMFLKELSDKEYLYKTQRALALKLDDIVERAEKQRLEARDLTDKINRWRNAVLNERAMQKNMHNSINTALEKKYQERYCAMERKRFYKQCIMNVVQEAEQELSKQFAGHDGNAYMDAVIEYARSTTHE